MSDQKKDNAFDGERVSRCPFAPFIPPYPKPHKTKSSFFLRFFRGWHSWLHVLFEKSYSMRMGEIRQPGGTVFMVNEPSWVRHILVGEARSFPKHDLMHQLLEPLLGVSIFTTNGAIWERQRRLVDQAFEQARLQLVFPAMQESVAALLLRLDKVADGRDFEVDGEMTYVTADVMFRTILSETLAEADAYSIYESFLLFQKHAQRASLLLMYRIWSWPARFACRKPAQMIRRILSEIIARRFEEVKQSGSSPKLDILNGLMQAVDPVAGDRFTYQETVDQVCMLFLAGHETSASALAWSLYLLSHRPDLQVRMREEIREHTIGGDLSFSAIRKLRLTSNVFREALRLYPPVGFFAREAVEDSRIRDKNVPAGSAVLISPWLIQRHRDLWERPDEFDPDRFDTLEGKES
ncbi:MAG: cytochrome P450, partial [Spartobacteria bacterium]|nr:cytochrome P450 [Spartobacteria bacterium]